jgi:hypothetical protein
MILHLGGKMEETETKLKRAMPADRSASSKEESCSLCLPTPLVRKIFFGRITIFASLSIRLFPKRRKIYGSGA